MKTIVPPPLQINYQGQKGLFVSFEFMDLNAEKLIDRKSLLSENKTLGAMVKNLKAQALAQAEKSRLKDQNITYLSALNLKGEGQITLLNGSLENQVQITKNNKRKARRNGLILFGGGVLVGITVFALLL